VTDVAAPPSDAARVSSTGARETFTSRFGTLMTVVGVAIGLGNVWRFPYMVGKFGGAAFVLFYVLVSVVIGVPALMAEFALGRYTRRGPVGAFANGGLPFGTAIGWFFFVVVTAATGYYTAVIGWVLYYAVGQLAAGLHIPLDASAVLPPDNGFVLKSFLLQLVCTGVVIGTCAADLDSGRPWIVCFERRRTPLLHEIMRAPPNAIRSRKLLDRH